MDNSSDLPVERIGLKSMVLFAVYHNNNCSVFLFYSP